MPVSAILYRRLIKYGIISQPSPNGLAVRIYDNHQKRKNTVVTKDDLKSTLEKGTEALNRLGLKYALGRGTLLGLYRDNSFTPGDHDIDIDIYSDESIYEIINALPFELMQITTSSGRYQQAVFIDQQNDVLFDIWFYNKTNNNFINKHMQGLFSLPIEKIQLMETVEYKGIKYPCLAPSWYCEYWFGKNWKSPKKYSKTWIEHYEMDCSGFSRNHEQNPIIIHIPDLSK